MPFATVVTGDRYDGFSKLGEGRYRVNIGVGKAGFLRLFGAGAMERGWDFAARDVVMPHPVYGRQWWACVVNPEEKWGEVEGLLREAGG